MTSESITARPTIQTMQNNTAETTAQNGHYTDISELLGKTDAEILAYIQQQRAKQADTPQTPDKDGAEKNDEREKFPSDCLPAKLRALADNVAVATNTPETISYAAGLCAVAASLGNRFTLETFKGETVMGNLFQLPIVDSGIGKSRAGKFMMRPIYDLHDARQETWKATFREAKADLDDIEDLINKCKAELKGTSNKELTEKGRDDVRDRLADLYEQQEEAERAMLKPELYTGNSTEAKLAKMLEDNDEVLNCFSFEAGNAVQTIAGKYNNSADKSSIKTEDSLMLNAFSQERYKNDRLTTESVELKAPTINMLWMVQPRYIGSLFGNQSLATGGFLARCLSFNSHAEPEELTGSEPEVSDRLMADFYKDLNLIFTQKAEVQPSNGAREAMRLYFNDNVRLRRGELRDIQQFPARWTENAWKIALCLHVMKHPRNAGDVQLSEKTAMDAIRIMRWFANQFLDLMKAGREDSVDQEGFALCQYIHKKGDAYRTGQNKSMSLRELVRSKRWGKAEDIRRIVSANLRDIRIESMTPPEGGRASERVVVCR